MAYLTTREVAKDLGLALRTIQVYCKEGFIPAKLIWLNGKTGYEIDCEEYLKWKNIHFRGIKKGQCSKYTRSTKERGREDILDISKDWLEWCSTGKLTGKPIAPRTVQLYKYYFGLYIQRLGKYPSKPLISIKNIRNVLGLFAAKSYSTKLNIYSALMSFSKYLILNNKLREDFRVELKELRPKRLLPAKKTSLNEGQLQKLIESINKIKGGISYYDRMTAKALIIFLANTGLRASELCRLKLKDVDFESLRVCIRLGKGNKDRIVGLNQQTCETLIHYLKARSNFDSEFFFINRIGNPFNRDALSHKINKLAKRAGFENISPHSLRRSFVTINAGKGKPLNHLRIACGHSDISTTQGYCMTSVDEVVEAMKNW